MGVDSGYNNPKTTKKPKQKPNPKPKPSGKAGRYAAQGKDKAVGQTGWDSVARDDLRDAVKSSLRGFDVTVQVKPGAAKKNKASIAKARSAGVNVVVAKGQQYLKSAGSRDPGTGLRIGYVAGTSARAQRAVAQGAAVAKRFAGYKPRLAAERAKNPTATSVSIQMTPEEKKTLKKFYRKGKYGEG